MITAANAELARSYSNQAMVSRRFTAASFRAVPAVTGSSLLKLVGQRVSARKHDTGTGPPCPSASRGHVRSTGAISIRELRQQRGIHLVLDRAPIEKHGAERGTGL